MSVPVHVMKHFDPGTDRLRVELPEGLTISEIVSASWPGLIGTQLEHVRVMLVTETGSALVPQALWERVRPKPGVQVVIRLVAGKDALRTVLSIVVTIAAIALGQFWAAGPFVQSLGITGALGTKVVAAGLTAGLSILGGLLINTLVPIEQPEQAGSPDPSYSISGFQNQLRPNGRVPMPIGQIRQAPPFAMRPYSEIVNGQQYIRACFCFGYGRLRIEDIRLGDTSLGEFTDYTLETREGVDTDQPLTLTPHQVIEEPVNVELVRPYPRDDSGEIISGSEAEETPTVRLTAPDTATASVILAFPTGQFGVDDKGRTIPISRVIRIRQRLMGAVDWTEVETIEIHTDERSPFYRQKTWDLPFRGQWEIECTRMTPETTSTTDVEGVYFAALQSIRPEYPINMTKPLALAAVRMKATAQLNGTIENFNALVTRYAPTWDGTNWTDAPTRNVASGGLAVLRGPANAFPVPDSGINWEEWAALFQFSADKGFNCDAILQSDDTLGQVMRKICSAGRAAPRHDGTRWGVIIDRPTDLVMGHLSDRNAQQFEWNRPYFDPPDGFRVPFLDETRGYTPSERIVPWPGHVGTIDTTESIELFGKTNPDEIWIETRRRMYELLHRPDRFTLLQDGASRVLARGDQAQTAFNTLDEALHTGRVKSVRGNYVELDTPIPATKGSGYAVRFRAFEDEHDETGQSVLRDASLPADNARAILLAGDGLLPVEGTLLHFGPKGSESMAMRVLSIEPSDGLSQTLHLIAAAPEIDTLTDAEVPPAWDGRVGSAVPIEEITPSAPRFSQISSGLSGTGDVDGLLVMIHAGTGTAAILTEFEVDHRLTGSTEWQTETVSVAAASLSIADYSYGNDVELRVRALAVGDVEGPYSSIVTVTIGSDDDPVPAALNETAITVTSDLGHAKISLAVPSSDAPAQIQVYRVPSGDTLNRELHASGDPFAVTAGSTATHVDGDGTRQDLLGGTWTEGSGWAGFTHTAGAAGDLEQVVTLTAGVIYRFGFVLSGVSGGSLQPMLTGGSDRPGTGVLADGRHTDEIQAVTGNDTVVFRASAAFAGTVGDISLFAVTDESIDAGSYDYYLEPQTVEGVPGPVTSAIPVVIR